MTTDVSSSALSEEEIFERIEVAPPYYDLQDLRLRADGSVSASFRITQPLLDEAGPISAAEAGRHLAILGSCAAALHQPDPGRFFYLAYDAEFRRARGRPPADVATLTATASHHFIDPGTAMAAVVAQTPDGQPVCSLSVYYLVVKEGDFRALFAAHARDVVAEPGYDPYRLGPQVSDVEIAGDRLTASLGEIEGQRCLGHFPGLPAMPVAFLMSHVVQSATLLLRERLESPDVKVIVREGSIRAEALAFVGERVDISVEYQGLYGGTHWLYCRAKADGDKTVGALHMKLRVPRQQQD